ncbi:MAG: ribosome biogenesis GTPase Der [Phycisphaerales bacterium]|nr:ribosome biogenesis GTPase Der [Phycisphaerales bacterium]
MSLPIVAIIGRPNVGKSSMLNLLAGQRISIVDPRAGITRDRVSTIIEHREHFFELMDTGGIGIIDDDRLESHVEEQIHFAIERADLILFLTDVRDGITPLDQTVVQRLRTTGKPIILVVNKVDVQSLVTEAAGFARLGISSMIEFSAKHARGRMELLDEIVDRLGSAASQAPAEPVMKLAIVGKRNAGKSTFVNALAGEPRVIVSETPGTTRDAVDVRFTRDGAEFVAIDTAGVRKKRKMDEIDFYSYTRALRSIQRADVVMLLIDATVPIGEVDLKLGRAVLDEFKPVVITLNKWDLVADRATTSDFAEYLGGTLPHLRYAPIVCVTAASGKNVQAAVDVAQALHRQARTRVTTGKLNAAIEEVLGERNPSAKAGAKAIKVYYATQISVAPPTIVCFCNRPELVREDYRRFMEGRLRELLPFAEVPIRLLFRERSGRAAAMPRSGRDS